MSRSIGRLWSAIQEHRARYPFSTAAALFLTASFAASSWLLYRLNTNTGELSGKFTDHWHHARTTDVFLHRGVVVWTKTLSEAAKMVPYPHDVAPWEMYPSFYPPGMHLVFLPPALFGRYVHTTMGRWGAYTNMYLMALACAGLYLFARHLERTHRPTAILLFALAWNCIVRMTLLGFYDGVLFIPAVLAITSFSRKRYEAALLWATFGLFVTVRGVILFPLGLASLLYLVRDARPSIGRKLAAILASFAMVGSTVWSLWVARKLAMQSTPDMMAVLYPLSAQPLEQRVVIVSGVIMSVCALRYADWVTALTLLMTIPLTIYHGNSSWHATMLFVPAALVGVVRPARDLGLMRTLTAIWIATWLPLYYSYSPHEFVQNLVVAVRQLR